MFSGCIVTETWSWTPAAASRAQTLQAKDTRTERERERERAGHLSGFRRMQSDEQAAVKLPPSRKDGKAKQDKFHCPANHEQNCLQLEPPHGPVSIPAAALFCSRLSESSPSSSSPPQPVGAAPASSSRNAQPRVSLLLPTLHEICAAQWPTLVYVLADVRDD